MAGESLNIITPHQREKHGSLHFSLCRSAGRHPPNLLGHTLHSEVWQTAFHPEINPVSTSSCFRIIILQPSLGFNDERKPERSPVSLVHYIQVPAHRFLGFKVISIGGINFSTLLLPPALCVSKTQIGLNKFRISLQAVTLGC